MAVGDEVERAMPGRRGLLVVFLGGAGGLVAVVLLALGSVGWRPLGNDGEVRARMREDPIYLYDAPRDLILGQERSDWCDSGGGGFTLATTIEVDPDNAAEVADLVQQELWDEGWRGLRDPSRAALFEDRTNKTLVKADEPDYRIALSAEPFEVYVSLRSDVACG